MHSSRLFSVLLTTVAAAITSVTALAVLPKTATLLEPRVFTHEDAILYGKDGRVQVISKAELARVEEELLGLNASTPVPVHFPAEKPKAPYANHTNEARSCEERTIFTMEDSITFVGKDVPMSSVVRSPNETVRRVTVSAGYSLSNSINMGVGGSYEVIEKFLSANFHIDYTTTWTTQYQANYLFEVPAGMVGAVVSNPTTTRHRGHVDTGCIGAAKRTPFYTDTYSTKSYDSLKWVDGIITLCLGQNWPLGRCIGEGHMT